MAQSAASWESYLSQEERQLFTQCFHAVSKSQPGVVTGPEAVQFFATSGVPNQILSDIWETADRDNVGYLTPETFAIALKLIACAQHGKEVADPILGISVPLPQFEGIKANGPSPAETITPAEREKYASIFNVHQPVNGQLDADKAKAVFLKSKLPTDTLGKIWALADVRQAGSLNQTEFVIAMHYIAKLMDGTIQALPAHLPSAVYTAANGGIPQQVSPVMTGSPAPPRAQAIDSLGSLAFSAGGKEQRAWDVTAQEKAQFDAFFDKIDGLRTGYVQGGEAVEFFKNSRLPERDLAHIWDLADAQQLGRLTRDQFAVAMHLIHKRLAGEPLPPTLPPSLVPPSPRVMPPSPAVQQHHTQPAPVQQPSQTGGVSLLDDQQDLLGDFPNEQFTRDTNQVNQMQNQMASLKLATGQAQSQKVDAQQTLEQLGAQKRELENELSQLRMAHEAEMKDLRELQEQIRQEEPAWQAAKQAHDDAQQQLVATQNEIANLQRSLEHSREESEQLRRRVREIQDETGTLQKQLDDLRAQTKQQTMMLDINRRQVTASEQDREQAARDLVDFKQERGIKDEDVPPMPAKEVVSSPSVHTASPAVASASPAVASAHSTPFFDFASPQVDSPFSQPLSGPEHQQHQQQQQQQKSPAFDFDAIFGSVSEPIQEEETAKPAAEKTKSRAPPPPPPQSRHRRQASEASSASTPSTTTTAKKARAPPPPPPAPPMSQKAAPVVDDFDAAFSGELTEADKTHLGFDDAFGTPTQNDKEEKGKQPESKGMQWASSFGGFDFSGQEKEDDWDSIFGGSTQPTTTTAEPKKTEGFGFEDAFANFGDAQPAHTNNDAITPPAATAAANTTPTATHPNSTANPSPVAASADPPLSSSSPSQQQSQQPQSQKSPFESTGNSNIDELIKMGFDQKAAKDALNRYDQDLVKASNFLLDQASK